MAMRLLPWDYGVRNLGRSPLRSLLCAGGAAAVVLLVLAAAAFVRGMGAALTASADTKNVILLGAGSEESVERSEITPAASGIAAASIQGIRERQGVRYVSPEIVVALIASTEKDGGLTGFTTFRGVTDRAFLVHPHVRIVEGAAPGPDEIMVGALAATRSGLPDASFAVGRSLYVDGRAWRIAGRFEAPGTVMDAEVWCNLEDLRIAVKRETDSAVVITLDEGEFGDVDLFTKQRLDLELVALPESEYYRKLFDFYAPVRFMVWMTAGLVAAGALLGGLNTLYATFSSRVRELGTLRALGFGHGALLLSLVQEAGLLAALGSLAAAAVGMLLLDGLAVRISMGAFGLVVDGPVTAAGLGAGLLLGVVGALPPAWRCLRMAVPEALRAA